MGSKKVFLTGFDQQAGWWFQNDYRRYFVAQSVVHAIEGMQEHAFSAEDKLRRRNLQIKQLRARVQDLKAKLLTAAERY